MSTKIVRGEELTDAELRAIKLRERLTVRQMIARLRAVWQPRRRRARRAA